MKRTLAAVVVSSLLVVVACSGSSSQDVEIPSDPDSGAPSSSGEPGPTGGDSGTADATSTDAAPTDSGVKESGPTAFTLTSSAYAEGGKIPDANTCTGANTSPPLAWVGAPPAAKSFAVVLTDKTNNLVHAVIYDVAKSLSSLPANVEKKYQPANVPGAKQTRAYDNVTFGYLGPCPPNQHTYEFALHALDIETLPETSQNTTRNQIVPLITTHSIAKATLTATYQKP